MPPDRTLHSQEIPTKREGASSAPAGKTVSWRTRAKAALNRKEGAIGLRPELAQAFVAEPVPMPARAMKARVPSAFDPAAVTPRLSSIGTPSPRKAAAGATIVVALSEEGFLAPLCADLRHEGYHVFAVESGADALVRVRATLPALVLLDLTLPNVPGLEVCKRLKADSFTAETQVILLSGEDNPLDRVVGFELGADDFVVMPCNLRELVLRVKAVLRRSMAGQERHVHTVGPIVVDQRQCAVYVHGQPVHVTAIEFKILALLAGRPGVVQSRDILLTEVWGDESAIYFRSVDTYLRRLRRKLGGAAGQLRTVRGLGYRLIP